MKILVAAAIYPPDPGGPATHAERFVSAAREGGHDIRVVVFSAYRELPPGIRHVAYFFALLNNIRGCDVLYAHDARSTGGPAYVLSVLTGTPLVLRIGGDVVWEKATESGTLALSMQEFYKEGRGRGFLFWGVRRVMQRAAKIIVTAPLLVEIYTKRYGIKGEKLVVLPNPLPSLPRSDLGNEATDKAMVFASRLVAYKNLDLLIDAFAAVYEEIAPAKLYLLGKGPEVLKLQEQVKRLGLTEKIIFGYRPRAEVDTLLSTVWGTIAPALTEFNPNYVLEGLTFGKPFLLSREHGLAFPVPEQLLFDPHDKKEVERKLVWFFSETGYKEAQELIKELPQQPSWNDNIMAQLSVLTSITQQS